MNLELHEAKLYDRLQDVIGTEKEIKLRQDMFRCMDIVNGFGDRDSISVSGGSLPEGLSVKGSDEDIMLLLKNINVVPENDVYTDRGQEVRVNMKMDSTRMGYASLFLTKDMEAYVTHDKNKEKSETMTIKRAIQSSGGECIVASSRFRGQFMLPGTESHGPCISDGIYDFAISLKGSCWPKKAKERLENICKASPNWISDTLSKELLSDGCIYVPVGPKHFYSGTLWRISFAMAEQRLVKAMNHTQMLCYGLLKIVLKEGIAKRLTEKDILCSYFLKTCMFWVIEETDNDENIWTKTRLYSCYQMCMNKLIEWAEHCNCSNYLIPENNMFVGKVDEKSKRGIIDILKEYRDGGYELLSKCETLGNYATIAGVLTESDREAGLDFLCFRSLHIYPFDEIETLLLGLNALEKEYQYQQHQFTRGVIDALLSSLHQQIPQMTKPGGTDEDKRRCIQNQKQHLLQGCRADKLSGLILLASFHCANGQYYTALEILSSVTQKLVPESGIILRRNPDYSNVEIRVYKDKFCGKDYTLQQKFEMATVRNIVQLDNSSVVPQEFQPEVYNYRPLILVPPAVYAHALRCICFLKVGNVLETNKTLRTLDALIDTKYLIRSIEGYYSTACTLVGACYEEMGDYDVARKYYEKAQNEKIPCRCVTYRLGRLDKKMKQLTSHDKELL